MSTQTVHVIRGKPKEDLRLLIEATARRLGLRAAYIITCVGSLTNASLRLANASESVQVRGVLGCAEFLCLSSILILQVLLIPARSCI